MKDRLVEGSRPFSMAEEKVDGPMWNSNPEI